MYDGAIAGRLLKHVTRLQSTNPNYYAYYAQWLHKKRKLPMWNIIRRKKNTYSWYIYAINRINYSTIYQRNI